MVFTTVLSVILLFILIQMLYKKLLSKPVQIRDHERFIIEVNRCKNLPYQVLVVYSNGYWEIKEESRSEEWSADRGVETYIDLETEIDDFRYFSIMGEALLRNDLGEHGISIRKEIDLTPAFNPFKSLRF
jgi:hypothetical protein